MANRVTTYKQAFGVLLEMEIGEKLQNVLKELEAEGHTERSISFTIWKKQDKLRQYRNDRRFIAVLKNEVAKWSWKKDDPRWQEYWKRKEEQKKIANYRKRLNKLIEEEHLGKHYEKIGRGRQKKFPGFVYFIQGQCGGAIKIGYSVEPEKRLKELQTGYPDTLVILLMIPGDTTTEASLHKRFEAARLKGEWFRSDPDVLEGIKEIASRFVVND